MDRLTEALISIVLAQYVLLFVAWGLVMIHYGSTAIASWRIQDGKLRGMASDFFYPVKWGWRRCFAALRLGRTDEYLTSPYTRFSSGTVLRVAITISAIAPCLSLVRPLLGGSILGSSSSMFWHIFILNFSIVGGVMHLYVAYRNLPGRWAFLAVLFSLWFLLGPVLIYFMRVS